MIRKKKTSSDFQVFPFSSSVDEKTIARYRKLVKFIEVEYDDLQMRNLRASVTTLQADLVTDQYDLIAFPEGKFTPSEFRAIA